MDFERLLAGRIVPPWSPSVIGSMDTSQFDLEFTSMAPIGRRGRGRGTENVCARERENGGGEELCV